MGRIEARLIAAVREGGGKPVPKAVIAERVWPSADGGPDWAEESLRVALCRLRRRYPGLPIRTVYGALAWVGEA